MVPAKIEHVNFTVADARSTAERLCQLFDWKVRWEGEAMAGDGYTVHVGTDEQYLAVYSPGDGLLSAAHSNYRQGSGLNHIGVVVDDIEAMEAHVKALGYKPINHADYEPGRRFYFHDDDNVEYEIVSYES